MMNGRDLRELLTSDIHIKRIFKGVYSRDKLPRYRMKKPSLLIVNTDHSKGPGEHWICIFVGINNVIEYWDSFEYGGKYLQDRDIPLMTFDQLKTQ